MCGIAGIVNYRSNAGGGAEELARVSDYMASRGPDGAGAWWNPDCSAGVAHRRLAIIDLSPRAAQPMLSDDGRFAITFNGEIYNHSDLREGLRSKGYVFRTTSDTEVLLNLYADQGSEMVAHLRGMFAFAIWDERKKELFLCRDHFGIKPLYYADDGNTFRFASLVKALMAGGRIGSALEPAALAGFCVLGSVPEPFTIYAGIRALPAGSTLLVKRDSVGKPRRYFNVSSVLKDAQSQRISGSERDIQAEVDDALRDSVRHHLVADVPVGLFLSSGIDSGVVAGLAAELNAAKAQNSLQAVTLGFHEFAAQSSDEIPLAKVIAAHYATGHSIKYVDKEQFTADLPKILSAMDQPTIDGINTWFVSKAARERGMKVALSGLGGDELFGGYPSFRDVPRWARVLSWPSRVPGLGGVFRQALTSSAVVRNRFNPKMPGMLEFGGSYEGAYLLRRGIFMPWELPDVLGPTVARLGLERLDLLGNVRAAMFPDPELPFARVAALEFSLYLRNQLLRDTDWASMAHSLEVRVPFVDHVLLKRLAPLLLAPERAAGKVWLAASPRPKLPDQIRNRPKSGFVIPIHRWLDGDTAAKNRSSRRPPARGHWSRRWAASVLRHYDVDVVQSAAA
jgi:asparagine synthase (glutamine-hydrolysing)